MTCPEDATIVDAAAYTGGEIVFDISTETSKTITLSFPTISPAVCFTFLNTWIRRTSDDFGLLQKYSTIFQKVKTGLKLKNSVNDFEARQSLFGKTSIYLLYRLNDVSKTTSR